MTDAFPDSLRRNALVECMPDAHEGRHLTGEELRQGSIPGVLPRAMALDAGYRFRDARMSWTRASLRELRRRPPREELPLARWGRWVPGATVVSWCGLA